MLFIPSVNLYMVGAATYFTLVSFIRFDHVEAFYVPGITAVDYSEGAKIMVKVSSLTSVKTQIPVDYYRFPFCRPTNVHRVRESLGELLAGEKVAPSPYIVEMKKNTTCKVLCASELLNDKHIQKLSHLIESMYHHNFILDNLPSASVSETQDHKKLSHYAGGFPVGYDDNNKKYLYNHLRLFIDYHQHDGSNGYRIVKFSIEPFSIHHRIGSGNYGNGKGIEDLKEEARKSKATWEGKKTFSDKVSEIIEENGLSGCVGTADEPKIMGPPLELDEGHAIFYSYDVIWKKSEVQWATRWDVYLTEGHRVPPIIHWSAIINSFIVLIILTVMLGAILVRNLRRDIAGYNAVRLTDEERMDETEESGWKLVHGDVFRPPKFAPMMLGVLAGTGAQLLLTAVFSIALAAVGFLNPTRRGSLLTGLVMIYTFSGIFAGYVSARLYKSFLGKEWQKCTLYTGAIFPGVLFLFFLLLNLVLKVYHPEAFVSFGSICILAFLWWCVSTPLVFIGAYFGYRKDIYEYPTRINSIERSIPQTGPLGNEHLLFLCAGFMPFASVYVELFFIMTSLWMDQFYYVFGFLLLIFTIAIITVSQLCSLILYYQLCAENHRWWWQSFVNGGSMAVYLFGYSCWWYPHIRAKRFSVTTLIYFGYMFIISGGTFLMMGTVGLFSSFWFIKKMYGSIKVE